MDESKKTQKDLLDYIEDAITDNKINRDQAFTIYGYASACVTFKMITIEDYQPVEKKLMEVFTLTVNDLDNVIG